jgi:hypothetical protein
MASKIISSLVSVLRLFSFLLSGRLPPREEFRSIATVLYIILAAATLICIARYWIVVWYITSPSGR